MKQFAALLTSFWKHPVTMEHLKASLEQVLGPSFVLYVLVEHTTTDTTMQEKLLIYDTHQPPLPLGRGVEIQRKGNTPEKLTMEELILLPLELQEEDARCIATMSRDEKNGLTVVIRRKQQQLNGPGEIVICKAFEVDQSTISRVLPRILQFLEGKTA